MLPTCQVRKQTLFQYASSKFVRESNAAPLEVKLLLLLLVLVLVLLLVLVLETKKREDTHLRVF